MMKESKHYYRATAVSQPDGSAKIALRLRGKIAKLCDEVDGATNIASLYLKNRRDTADLRSAAVNTEGVMIFRDDTSGFDFPDDVTDNGPVFAVQERQASLWKIPGCSLLLGINEAGGHDYFLVRRVEDNTDHDGSRGAIYRTASGKAVTLSEYRCINDIREIFEFLSLEKDDLVALRNGLYRLVPSEARSSHTL